MSEHNLYGDEAKAKIKEMAEEIDFTIMCTKLTEKPSHAIPMSTKEVDDNGHIWFLSGRDSNHNSHLNEDSAIQLHYIDPKSMHFLTLFGQARIHTNKTRLKELYQSSDDAWFSSVDDPNLSAIEVVPTQAHYWDSKHNRLVTLMKIGISGMTGNQPDISEHGKLHV